MADVLLVIAVLVYAILTGIAMFDILPFALILLVASIPVALARDFHGGHGTGRVGIDQARCAGNRCRPIPAAVTLQREREVGTLGVA